MTDEQKKAQPKKYYFIQAMFRIAWFFRDFLLLCILNAPIFFFSIVLFCSAGPAGVALAILFSLIVFMYAILSTIFSHHHVVKSIIQNYRSIQLFYLLGVIFRQYALSKKEPLILPKSSHIDEDVELEHHIYRSTEAFLTGRPLKQRDYFEKPEQPLGLIQIEERYSDEMSENDSNIPLYSLNTETAAASAARIVPISKHEIRNRLFGAFLVIIYCILYLLWFCSLMFAAGSIFAGITIGIGTNLKNVVTKFGMLITLAIIIYNEYLVIKQQIMIVKITLMDWDKSRARRIRWKYLYRILFILEKTPLQIFLRRLPIYLATLIFASIAFIGLQLVNEIEASAFLDVLALIFSGTVPKLIDLETLEEKKIKQKKNEEIILKLLPPKPKEKQ